VFHKILAAIDGSVGSDKALAAAVDVAAYYHADLTALGVAEFPEVVGTVGEADELRRAAEDHFREVGEAAMRYARGRGVALRSVVVRGHPAEAIVRYAEHERMDLVVLGQHGHSRIARFFLGSTSDRVSEHCHCSVLIVK
jgi:nucleotide-binding universal stress UspA family protein